MLAAVVFAFVASDVHADVSDQKQVAPADVMKDIRDSAAKDNPGDYTTQKALIDQQVKAWKDMQTAPANVPANVPPNVPANVPADVMKDIRDSAAKDNPGDYSIQKMVIDQQVKAWKDINGKQ